MATATDRPPWPLLRLLIGRRSADFAQPRNTEGLPPDPVNIPYSWLNPPLIRRPSQVINSAAISQSGGATAYSTDQASIDQYGVGANSETLNTAVDADASNLAAHQTTFYATPRPRQPTVRLNLLRRTDDECLRILGVALAMRVRITNPPTSWPAGAVAFVVEGIKHVIAPDERTVEWTTSAPVGSVAGTPGPWFRWDSSSWDGIDLRPF